MLFGVCAGLAQSRGWSVGLIRLAALFLLPLSGLVAVLYLVLALLIPTASTKSIVEPERLPFEPLERDKENGWIGGVCSGLARCFERDILLIRGLFVFFVFAGVLSVLPYFFAWIAFPARPKTAA